RCEKKVCRESRRRRACRQGSSSRSPRLDFSVFFFVLLTLASGGRSDGLAFQRSVHFGSEHLRRTGRQNLAGRNLNRFARLRIAADARTLFAHHEISEAGNLDFMALRQSVFNGVEY